MASDEIVVLLSGVLCGMVALFLAWRRPWIGLLLSPVACLWLVFVGSVLELPIVVAIGPVLVLMGAIIVLARPLDPLASPRVRQWARFVLFGTLAILGFGAMTIGWSLKIPAILLFLSVYAVFKCAIEPKGAVTDAVVSTLAGCARQNLPLAMALDSAAYGRQDMAGYTMRQIGRWLVQGYSLSEAIRRGFPRCPQDTYRTIAAAEAAGQLGTALVALEQARQERGQRHWLVSPVYKFYPIFLIVAVMVLLSAYLRFIMPRYALILDEIETIPLATRLLLAECRYIGDWPFWLPILVAMVIWVIVRFWGSLAGGAFGRGRLARTIQTIQWYMPLTGWFARCRSVIDAILMLRLALVAGNTIDRAIELAASAGINYCLERRLNRWLKAVRNGQDVAKAAIQNRVPGVLAWAFEANSGAGQTISILEAAESVCRASYVHCARMMTVVAWPCVTIAVGCVVGLVAFATFGVIQATISMGMDFVP